MAVVRRNFTNIVMPDVLDDEYIQCNFTQSQPRDASGLMRGQRLFPGDDTPRTFRDCNLVNAEPPPGSTIIKCNTVVRGRNIVDSGDTVTFDGQAFRQKAYQATIYGKWDVGAADYVYFDPPRVVNEGPVR